MNYIKCIKCGIILPASYMTFVIINTPRGKARVAICPTCKRKIQNEKK